jgi:alpha-L-rhamnosidase
MTYAKGYYDSPYGRINSSWKTAGNSLVYTATVPANTKATLYLPAPSASAVTEAGKPAAKAKGIKFLRYADGKAVYELASGSYVFSVGK